MTEKEGQEFRETVLISLAKLEMGIEVNSKEHTEIQKDIYEITRLCVSIEPLKLSMLNHLHHHELYMRYLVYPLLVLVIAAAAATFAKLVLHVF